MECDVNRVSSLPMRVLIIGGTGLISTGIVTHLLDRGADITMLNRGQRENTLPRGKVAAITGDRYQRPVLDAAAAQNFDAVIDMCCFDPATCKAALDAFAGKTRHFIFCSTVCTYGVKSPVEVLVDEDFPQEPISTYGKNKLACEHEVLAAHARGDFAATVMRPSCTYGPGNPLIDNIEVDAVAWDRIAKGLPVLCAGDGLGLWVATHRDDVGAGFAYAVLNQQTFGQCYNLTRAEHTTWRDYYRLVAAALGQPARLVFLPAAAIIHTDEKRFGLLREITRFHGAYDSSKAETHIPEFLPEVGLTAGAAQTFADIKRRKAWRDSANDPVYESLLAQAAKLGITPVEA
jgi:nucleoside-diphosphate-sugar epimerase